MYSLEEISKAKTKEPMLSISKSKGKYKSTFENAFEILEDTQQIVGVDDSMQKIQIETLFESRKPALFVDHRAFIYSLKYHSTTRSLFVGDNLSFLSQYDFNQGRSFGKLQRKFKLPDVGEILSMKVYRNLLILGGSQGVAKVINVLSKGALMETCEVGVGWVLSIQVFDFEKDRVLVVASGEYVDYSDGKTDVFALSGFSQKGSKSSKLISKNKRSNS